MKGGGGQEEEEEGEEEEEEEDEKEVEVRDLWDPLLTMGGWPDGSEEGRLGTTIGAARLLRELWEENEEEEQACMDERDEALLS